MAGNNLKDFNKKTTRPGDIIIFKGQSRSIQAIRFDGETGDAVIGLGFGDELVLSDGESYEVPAEPGVPGDQNEADQNMGDE